MGNIITFLAEAIVNYLLVGSVIAGIAVPLAWGIIKVARIRTPVYRHMIWSYLLIGVIVLPAIWLYAPKLTLAVLPARIELPKVVSLQENYFDNAFVPGKEPSAHAHGPGSVYGEMSIKNNVGARTFPIKVTLAGMWFTAFVFLLARLGVGWHRLRRICRMATLLPESEWRVHEKDRRLTICLTSQLQGPVCFGVFRPMILLPQDMYKNGTPESLQMILSHELAHIERRDCWANLFQRIIESLFFFHPLVWLASRQLTQERERVCDNHVLAEGISADDYTTLLSQIGEQAVHVRYLQTVALFEGQLLSRIRSLLDPLTNRQTKLSWQISFVSAVMVLATLLVFGSVRLAAKPSEAAITENIAVLSTTESLHQAAAQGDIRLIESLISQGADVNAKDEEGLTPLHRAVVWRNERVIKLLLANGADINAKDGRGWTAVDGVADRRRKDIAELLLSHSDDISLYTAAYVGYLQKVKELVDAGTDVNAKNVDGQTGLHGAAKYCHMDVIEYLLDKGARINEKDSNGETALHYAARCNGVPSATPKDLIALLLSKGAGLNEKNLRGETPVETALPWQSKEVIDLLIDKGADVSAIHLAAYTGDLDKVKSLVELGKNAGAANSDGLTPLHAAAISGQKDVAEFLIGKGVDINVHYQPNRRPGPMDAIPTPLYYAADSGHANIVKLLIDAGANMDVAEMSYFSPLSSAILGGHNDVAELLITGGADVSNLGRQGIAPLHWAAMMGNSDVFGQLISHGADVDIKANQSNVGNSPLHYVVQNQKMAAEQRKEMCELLLTQSADVNIENLKGQTPLHSAVRVGDVSIVKLLIKKGANVNAKDKSGRTPLSLAEREGHTEIVELLRNHGVTNDTAAALKESQPAKPTNQADADGDIEEVKALLDQGVDINAKDDGGRTQLHRASLGGHEKLVRLLISKGADVNVQEDQGFRATPLHHAVHRDHRDIVEILLAHGADIDIKDRNGRTPLDMAKRRGNAEIVEILTKAMKQPKQAKTIHEAAAAGDIELVALLISQGADVNAKEKDFRGFTPMYYAVQNGHKEVIEILLANGADINAGDKFGYMPLYPAIWSNDRDTVRFMIENGAEVNLVAEDDYPPLYYAVMNNDLESVELLLAKGARFDVKTFDGSTIFYHAAWMGNREIVKFFASKGADISTFHLAACMGDSDRVKSSIEQGTDLNEKDEHGWTALHWAASMEQEEVAKFLLARGADVDAKTKEDETPLHHAAVSGARAIVELLIDRGAEVKARSKDGRTPLHRAATKGDNDVIELLIDNGADISEKNNQGAASLWFACAAGKRDTAAFLIAKGANVHAKTKSGWTVLHRAASNGHSDVVSLLINKGADIAAKNNSGQTPLHRAASLGRLRVVELLIARGADVNTQANKGQTALSLAKERSHTKVVELLRKQGAKE